ncbi:MAG: AMP-binding protein [Chitinophagaceae bacterium]|nr:AMP-binding protein [Chitinophagaceae bacterium]MCW5905172.1 AMP-binding protein [Chitinophagaceae bacterium]
MNYKNYTALSINGQCLKEQGIIEYCRNSHEDYLIHIANFLEEWFNEQDSITLQTSGSTGEPKKITVAKKQMLLSADATAKYFHFQEKQTALLALPATYIAGKMMIVRALYSQLNLVCIAPSNNPFEKINKNVAIDFMPLTPTQLNGVNNTYLVKKILLGGAPISHELAEQCQNLQAEIYHGYGMTETLSHVALRLVNGSNQSVFYQALPNVSFTQDERECLIIHAPFLQQPIITNDIVRLKNNSSFIWQGRYDNIINSGGIKLQPEVIEEKLTPLIKEPYFISAIPDKVLGEKLCLFIEHIAYNTYSLQALKNNMNQCLTKYETPKEIYFIENFSYTNSGKIQRQQTIQQFVNSQ